MLVLVLVLRSMRLLRGVRSRLVLRYMVDAPQSCTALLVVSIHISLGGLAPALGPRYGE